MKIYFLFAGLCPGPSPGFSSRGGQETRRRGHIFKIQRWMYAATGGPNVKWGAGHHWPPAGDGPAYVWSIYRKKRQKYACFMDDALKIRGIEYLNVETCLLLAPPIEISGYAPGRGARAQYQTQAKLVGRDAMSICNEPNASQTGPYCVNQSFLHTYIYEETRLSLFF